MIARQVANPKFQHLAVVTQIPNGQQCQDWQQASILSVWYAEGDEWLWQNLFQRSLPNMPAQEYFLVKALWVKSLPLVKICQHIFCSQNCSIYLFLNVNANVMGFGGKSWFQASFHLSSKIVHTFF